MNDKLKLRLLEKQLSEIERKAGKEKTEKAYGDFPFNESSLTKDAFDFIDVLIQTGTTSSDDILSSLMEEFGFDQSMAIDVYDEYNQKLSDHTEEDVEDEEAVENKDKVEFIKQESICNKCRQKIPEGKEENLQMIGYGGKLTENRILCSRCINESNDEDESKFYVYIENGNEKGIGLISKKDDEWHEKILHGDIYGFGGKDYMGYLTKRDILQWLYKDYDNVTVIDESEIDDYLPLETEEEEEFEEATQQKLEKPTLKESEEFSVTVDGKLIHWEKGKGFTEASDLDLKTWPPIIKVKDKTKTITFYKVKPKVDSEGDLLYYTYKSDEGLTLIIFND